MPYWDPAKPIPAQLNKNNNVNMPLPANLGSQALKTIATYDVLNARLLPTMRPSTMLPEGKCQTRTRRRRTRFFGRSIRFSSPYMNAVGTIRVLPAVPWVEGKLTSGIPGGDAGDISIGDLQYSCRRRYLMLTRADYGRISAT